MKKVGIITFHAAHNYGSMLQAYALQQVILNMGYQCEIINFRTERQKNIYKPTYLKGTIMRKMFLALLYLPYLGSLYYFSIHNQLLLNNLQVISQKYGRNL